MRGFTKMTALALLVHFIDLSYIPTFHFLVFPHRIARSSGVKDTTSEHFAHFITNGHLRKEPLRSSRYELLPNEPCVGQEARSLQIHYTAERSFAF